MRISMSTNELNTNKLDNEEKINKKEIAGNQTDDKAINNKNDKCESKDLHINESILSEEILEDLKKNRTNHMEYMPDMEVLDSDIDKQVIEAMNNYDYDKYTAKDVENAINATNRTPEDFAALLSPAALPYLEQMAQAAKIEKERHFGNSICFFTPIYIANYCENYCIYCGFNCHNKIKRAKLNYEEIEEEMQAIAKSGLQEILILTGESKKMSSVEYIGEACKIARKYFKVIGLEVYPMNSDEYAYLHKCGADYVTVFQETYNSDKYETLHLAGHKRIYPYRLNAQERALKGGMRGVGFAALLGLDDFRKDAFATGMHAYLLQRKYPHAEIAFSCPRLRPIINNDRINPKDVHEAQLLQVVTAYRLFMPFASITVSTRECARVRDNLMNIAATKISAGVSTGIGSHSDDIEDSDKGDEQFEISDGRDVKEVYDDLVKIGLQPVMSDYIYVG
uniref:2-iminoacetate synthase ThiH n=1 Tax=Lachnospira sp. TaxID=2049031 RepID=UPI003FEDBC8B